MALLKSSSYARKGLNTHHGGHGGGHDIVRVTLFVRDIRSWTP